MLPPVNSRGAGALFSDCHPAPRLRVSAFHTAPDPNRPADNGGLRCGGLCRERVTPAMRAASLANCTKTPTIYRWLKRYKRDGEQTALIPLAQLIGTSAFPRPQPRQ